MDHMIWYSNIDLNLFPIVVITDQSPLTVMKYTQGTSIFSKILRRRDEPYGALIMVSFESYIQNVIEYFSVSLRQVGGIKYLNQMSTYHLACGDSEITT